MSDRASRRVRVRNRRGIRRVHAGAVSMVAVLILVACGDDTAISVEEAAVRVRESAVPSRLLSGQRLFAENCAACHGVHGEGSEDGPPMLHPFQARMHGDYAFERAVREGVQPHHYQLGEMPPIEELTNDEIDAIVAFVRWMQETAGLR